METYKPGRDSMETHRSEGDSADPTTEAVDALVALFADIQLEEKNLRELKPSKDYFNSEDDAMAEEDADGHTLEHLEDDLTEKWGEVAPEMKGKVLEKLLGMGRADVVKQIAKFSDVSEFVDVETLK